MPLTILFTIYSLSVDIERIFSMFNLAIETQKCDRKRKGGQVSSFYI